MHYSVKGLTLKTENAAKPIGYASAVVLKWIEALPSRYLVLDYGCGKLRHAVPLSRAVRHVVAVDSIEQIDREQRVGRARTSVRRYATRLSNVTVSGIHEGGWRRRRYDAALCANVLSAIPTRAARIVALQNMASVLKRRSGTILVTTQFRNSHFSGYEEHPGAEWLRDGWLVQSTRGVSFYALLDRTDVSALCRAAGLNVVEARHVGETSLVTCQGRPR